MLRGDITSAIRAAVMQELAEVGYGRLSIEGVARRAGVGKTAVYRRWSSKLALVLDVVSDLAVRKMPLPDTGSLRDDLEILLQIINQVLKHRLASQVVPDLLAEAARNPQIAETLQQALRANQRNVADQLLGRAIARGELSPQIDTEAAVDLIIGPLYWRLAISRTRIPQGHLPRLAAVTAAALQSELMSPPPPAPRPPAPPASEAAPRPAAPPATETAPATVVPPVTTPPPGATVTA
ncbi:TetR/AcrR family transcriptional regulator [Micromonospora siamensis]|uniref:TetR/AcrR family transcriptional regulator n=1 Tax=Micromonospora siamensis TaxID=299152 RepID=UPI00155F85D2|nr:TetR/AcrR family transcriptional regulator [Micromonospora siamensis]